MTDPLKLAERFDGFEAEDGTKFCAFAMTEREANLIAAALRLAEASMLSWYRGGGRVFIDVDESAFDAYRAAREGR